jgi:murein DD-endopeptidase MepM/ murein hydrolase activator NlpD
MKQKYYTIQIIPDGSNQIKVYRVSRFLFKLFGWLATLVLVFLCIIIWKLTEINAMLTTSRNLKNTNEHLISRHLEYEIAFEELDSIYAMERQILNILETYLENDSGKIQSILDRNRFKHIPSHRTKIDMDWNWQERLAKGKPTDHIPNILPVIGIISKRYSENDNHFGTDFAAMMYEPVFSTASGKVIFVGNKGDLGKVVEISHENDLTTRYGHLSSYNVRKGDMVRKGETIGSVGNTGKTTGPHLHYEILQNGKNINPENYFNE